MALNGQEKDHEKNGLNFLNGVVAEIGERVILGAFTETFQVAHRAEDNSGGCFTAIATKPSYHGGFDLGIVLEARQAH